MTDETRQHDEDAVRALYRQMMDAWNRGSGDAFAAVVAEDGDLVGFDGTHLRGRQEIASFHQRLFDTYVKGSRLHGKVRSVRFLTSEVAVMHAIGGTVMAGETDLAPERNSVMTLVGTKVDGEWRVAAFQNTRAQFIGRPTEAEALAQELREQLAADGGHAREEERR